MLGPKDKCIAYAAQLSTSNKSMKMFHTLNHNKVMVGTDSACGDQFHPLQAVILHDPTQPQDPRARLEMTACNLFSKSINRPKMILTAPLAPDSLRGHGQKPLLQSTVDQYLPRMLSLSKSEALLRLDRNRTLISQ